MNNPDKQRAIWVVACTGSEASSLDGSCFRSTICANIVTKMLNEKRRNAINSTTAIVFSSLVGLVLVRIVRTGPYVKPPAKTATTVSEFAMLRYDADVV